MDFESRKLYKRTFVKILKVYMNIYILICTNESFPKTLKKKKKKETIYPDSE